jgi:hypothetical protein
MKADTFSKTTYQEPQHHPRLKDQQQPWHLILFSHPPQNVLLPSPLRIKKKFDQSFDQKVQSKKYYG